MSKRKQTNLEACYNWKQNVVLYIHDLLYMLVAILLLFLLVFRVIIVSGSSMYSTLIDGDYLLLVSNLFYQQPQYGDIIVAGKQSFDNGFQVEKADDWQRYGDPWSRRRDDRIVTVEFADQKVLAVPYDMPVIGFRTRNIGTLRLWQSEPMEEFDFRLFNDQEYALAVQKTALSTQKQQEKSQTSNATYTVGQRVKHKAFGEGMILSAVPMGNDTLLEVAFDTKGTKKIMANFAKLETL